MTGHFWCFSCFPYILLPWAGVLLQALEDSPVAYALSCAAVNAGLRATIHCMTTKAVFIRHIVQENQKCIMCVCGGGMGGVWVCAVEIRVLSFCWAKRAKRSQSFPRKLFQQFGEKKVWRIECLGDLGATCITNIVNVLNYCGSNTNIGLWRKILDIFIQQSGRTSASFQLLPVFFLSVYNEEGPKNTWPNNANPFPV